MMTKNQANLLVALVAQGKKQLAFEEFVGPIVLINSGHGVHHTSGAFHHWENDIRICFEQFFKHYTETQIDQYLDFIASILNFQIEVLKLPKIDNGIKCLQKLAISKANSFVGENTNHIVNEINSIFQTNST